MSFAGGRLHRCSPHAAPRAHAVWFCYLEQHRNTPLLPCRTRTSTGNAGDAPRRPTNLDLPAGQRLPRARHIERNPHEPRLDHLEERQPGPRHAHPRVWQRRLPHRVLPHAGLPLHQLRGLRHGGHHRRLHRVRPGAALLPGFRRQGLLVRPVWRQALACPGPGGLRALRDAGGHSLRARPQPVRPPAAGLRLLHGCHPLRDLRPALPGPLPGLHRPLRRV